MTGYTVGTPHPTVTGIPPAQLRIGDRVSVDGLSGSFVVVGLDDSALVRLELPNGCALKVGWRRLRWPT